MIVLYCIENRPLFGEFASKNILAHFSLTVSRFLRHPEDCSMLVVSVAIGVAEITLVVALLVILPVVLT